MVLSTAVCNSLILGFSSIGIVYFAVMSFMNVNLLDFNSFSYDREYIKRHKFVMTNSCYLPVSFIKNALTQVDRKKTVEILDNLINSLPIAIDIEKGLFEFSLNYIKTSSLEESDFKVVYYDKLYEIYDNLDMNNKHINSDLQY